MTLFRLDASINPGQSASRAIADIVEAEWYQAYPGGTVIRRHVGTDPLPADAWAHAVAGARIPEADHSESQRAGVALAAGSPASLPPRTRCCSRCRCITSASPST